MFNIERWQEIFDVIKKNRLRTVLTGISVASGIFILVILLGFNSGIQNGVRSQFEQDATNRIYVRTGITSKGYKGLNPGRKIQLYNEDYIDFNNRYKDEIEYRTSLYSIWGAQIAYKNETGNYRLEGANPDMQFIENASMTNGRFINLTDIKESKKVAIIGYQVQKELFKEKDPIGKSIAIKGINFRVVGVYSDPGGERENTRVFIPVSTAQKIFNGANKVQAISYTFPMSGDLDESVAKSIAFAKNIERDIRVKYSVAPSDQGAVI